MICFQFVANCQHIKILVNKLISLKKMLLYFVKDTMLRRLLNASINTRPVNGANLNHIVPFFVVVGGVGGGRDEATLGHLSLG